MRGQSQKYKACLGHRVVAHSDWSQACSTFWAWEKLRVVAVGMECY